jgi:uncharacterized protein (TIGR03435 family)
MIRISVSIILAVTMCVAAFAQTPSPAFELADVHVSARSVNPTMRGGFIRGGRYELLTATMVDLIRTAWDVEAANVVGGPAWLETDRFDVIAKVPPNTTQENLKLMLQNLLADRFHLAVHNDNKALSGYALTFVKKSSQMKESDGAGEGGCRNQQPPPDPTPSGIGFAAYSCRGVSMSAFGVLLRGMAPGYVGGNPVADQTGLKGKWDFDIKWNGRGQLAAAGSDAISLFDAVARLGLKLAVENVTQSVVVVDRVNEKPSDNAPGVGASLPAVPMEFEVANIRPSEPGATESGRIQNGRIDFQGITMKDLIKTAWEIDDADDDVIVGGPKWLDVDRFTIVAKAASSMSASGQQLDFEAMQQMLKALLIDRFKIASHSDTQPVTVYALVAAKPKMKPADPSNRTGCKNAATTNVTSALSRTVTCQNISMAQFADKLSSIAGGYIDHPVVDLSSIDGSWDFTLSFSPKRALQFGGGRGGDAQGNGGAGVAIDPNGAVSLFEALEKQLGVRLEQRKHPMLVLVIDHIEEKPTDN